MMMNASWRRPTAEWTCCVTGNPCMDTGVTKGMPTRQSMWANNITYTDCALINLTRRRDWECRDWGSLDWGRLDWE